MIGFNGCFSIVFIFTIYAATLCFFPLYRHKISAKFFVVYSSCLLFLLLGLFISSLNDIVFNSKTWFVSFESFTLFSDMIENYISFSLNPLSFSFATLVLVIGGSTNIYILNYFKNEADELSFAYWLNSFICSMLILLFAANFFTLFLGWELIGLTSFFLINFWQTRRGTLKSSYKAFSFNLISDIFLLLAFVCFYMCSQTTDCETFTYLAVWEGLGSDSVLSAGLFCLTLCASIKSVQLFGHLWLPDSMEAPVPASALIHSATLVSAGVYLLCKFNILYIVCGWTTVLALVGSLTAAYGGIVAASQTDMKKLLAYSTMSHCGFLWTLASTGNFFITVLYLFLHGLFKAATFYCAGSFIKVYGTQDTRWMGSGHLFLRLDTGLLLLCSGNLAGLPFTIGSLYKYFFFKLLLINNFNWSVLGLLFLGMLSSLVYFFRLVFYVTFDFYKNVKATPYYFLMLTKDVAIKELKLVTINHIVAVTILLTASTVVGFCFAWLLSSNPLSFEYAFDLSGFELGLFKLAAVYSSYYVYFYYIYAVIFLTVMLVMWRKNIIAVESSVSVIYFFLLFLV